MLLWEALEASRRQLQSNPRNGSAQPTARVQTRRLPYDNRCAAATKAGHRCRGRIRPGSEFCLFHDPAMTAQRRQSMAARATQSRRKLMNLPDGYLRKLNSTAAVGEAMDRLYREIRLGLITPEMGQVLFNILTRLMDAGLIPLGPRPDRTRAARIRPKLSELLTRQERRAWKRAVANAPQTTGDPQQPTPASTEPHRTPATDPPARTSAVEQPRRVPSRGPTEPADSPATEPLRAPADDPLTPFKRAVAQRRQRTDQTPASTALAYRPAS